MRRALVALIVANHADVRRRVQWLFMRRSQESTGKSLVTGAETQKGRQIRLPKVVWCCYTGDSSRPDESVSMSTASSTIERYLLLLSSEASHRREGQNCPFQLSITRGGGPNMANTAKVLNWAYRMAMPATAAGFLISQSIFDVKGGTRAVIFDRMSGVKEDVINEGTHFLIPWLQKSVIFDVRTKPRNIATTTGSKDLQMVSLTLRVLHRPYVKALPKIYQVSCYSTSDLFSLACLLNALFAESRKRLR